MYTSEVRRSRKAGVWACMGWFTKAQVKKLTYGQIPELRIIRPIEYHRDESTDISIVCRFLATHISRGEKSKKLLRKTWPMCSTTLKIIIH